MADQWRDSRFGQFADPNFGKNLYSPQTPAGSSGGTAAGSGIDYSNQPFGQDGSFNTGYWDKWALGRYNTMGNSNQMTPWGTGIELGGGKVWDAPRGDWNYYSRDENDPNKINWSKDKPDWDHQLSPWGTAIEEGGSQDQHLAGWFAEGGAVEGEEEYPEQQTQQRVPQAQNKFSQSSQGMLPEPPDESKPRDPETENEPAEEAKQNVNRIMEALAFGRGKHGLPTVFFGGTSGVRFEDGGEVPGEMPNEQGGVLPDTQGGNPKMAMNYLTGADAAPPEFVQQVERSADPQGMMSPSERKLRALENAPDPEKAWGVMQHYRKRFNAYSAFAQAAAAGNEEVGKPPNLAAAAKAATQAYENIPDGNEVMFRPVNGGMEVSYRPIIPSRPAPSGGEKPPPFNTGLPKMTGNIPTIPAPNGGEKPPPFNAGEEDMLYAAEGGVIPGEDEEYAGESDVTGTVTSSGEGADVPGSRGYGGVAPPQGELPQVTGAGLEAQAQQYRNPGDGDTSGIQKVVMAIPQFIQWLRGSGQVDEVMDKGLQEALKAGAMASGDAQFAHGQDGPGAPPQSAQAPQPQAPQAGGGQEVGAQAVDPKQAKYDDHRATLKQRSGMSDEEYRPAQQRERIPRELRLEAQELFPWASQDAERTAWIASELRSQRSHGEKVEIANIGADWREKTAAARAQGMIDAQQLRNEGGIKKQEVANQGSFAVAEVRQAQSRYFADMKREVEQMKARNLNINQMNARLAQLTSSAMTADNRLAREYGGDPQKAIEAFRQMLQQPAQAQQQAPQATPPQGQAPQPGQAPRQAAGQPPAHMLKEGVNTQFKNGTTWTLRGGVPVEVK
jgi:hypothetical protein